MELKDRLYQALIENPMNFPEAAKEIGVNEHMLRKFLNKEDHPLQLKSKLLIEKWLKNKELE